MRASVLVAMGLLYFVWGSTYLAIGISVETMQPLVATGVRCFTSGLITLGVLAALGRLGPRPSWNELRGSALAGSWILIGGVGMVAVTETHVATNLTAVLASTTSLWVVGYRALDRERIGRGAIVGAAVGVAGVAVLLTPSGSGSHDPWLLLALLAALFWSTGSYYGRRITQASDPFVGAVVQMLCAGTVMVVAGVVVDGADSLDPSTPSTRSWLALAYLALAGASAFTAYVWALQNLPISTVVSHQYVNPAVAVLLGALVLDEGLGTSALIGVVLVIAAVFATVRSDASPSPVPEELVPDDPVRT
jgi:drug/metabolite transporter (DMT)-like permease